ncbi:MAG: histidinol-phosphate transaminase [Myxococcota bacterium]
MFKPMPAIAAMNSYRSARSLIPTSVRLDGNEGRLPPAEVLDSVSQAGPELLRRYPSKAKLEAALGEQVGVPGANVIVTNGADDALDRVARAYVGAGRSLVTAGPTFEMIERYVNIAGGAYEEVPWWKAPFPLEALSAAVREDTSVVAVVTPNNPTGLAASADEVRSVIERFSDRVCLIDLAYAEFATEDLTPMLLRYDNVVVTRTLSKAWSLAGARVGYAIAGNQEIIDHLRNAGGPYPVGGPSLAVAEAWLAAGLDHVEDSRTVVFAERDALSALLEELGAQPFPSEANYVCARFHDVQWVYDVLASVGIAIRAFVDKPKLSDCARVTCPQDEAIMNRAHNALRAALAPEGIVVQEALASDLDLEELRSAGIPVQVDHTPPTGKPMWWLARFGFELARARDVPSFAFGLAQDEAQRAGAARSFSDLEAVRTAWQSAHRRSR